MKILAVWNDGNNGCMEILHIWEINRSGVT